MSELDNKIAKFITRYKLFLSDPVKTGQLSLFYQLLAGRVVYTILGRFHISSMDCRFEERKVTVTMTLLEGTEKATFIFPSVLMGLSDAEIYWVTKTLYLGYSYEEPTLVIPDNCEVFNYAIQNNRCKFVRGSLSTALHKLGKELFDGPDHSVSESTLSE